MGNPSTSVLCLVQPWPDLILNISIRVVVEDGFRKLLMGDGHKSGLFQP